MKDKLPIYLVLLPTGLFSKEKVELNVIVGHKLNRKAAEELSKTVPGSYIDKVFADK